MYVNPEPHTRYGLELATKYQFYPGYAIYEPGFMRLGSSLAKFYPRAPMPIYRLMFSDGSSFASQIGSGR